MLDRAPEEEPSAAADFWHRDTVFHIEQQDIHGTGGSVDLDEVQHKFMSYLHIGPHDRVQPHGQAPSSVRLALRPLGSSLLHPS